MYNKNTQRMDEASHDSWFALFPARMREISRPRLKAWLNRMRDWNVDTKGNHEKNTMGAKITAPIPASYIREISRTESHSPRVFTTRFHVMARHKIHHPVAKKASALANKSAIVKSVNPIRHAIAAMMPIARRPCRNRINIGKAVDFLGVAVKSLNRRTITRSTIHEKPYIARDVLCAVILSLYTMPYWNRRNLRLRIVSRIRPLKVWI